MEKDDFGDMPWPDAGGDPARLEHQRLLDKWLIEGLTDAEKAHLPAGVLERAQDRLRAMIQEGLDDLDRGNVVDGEEFFRQWDVRIEEARKKTKKND